MWLVCVNLRRNLRGNLQSCDWKSSLEFAVDQRQGCRECRHYSNSWIHPHPSISTCRKVSLPCHSNIARVGEGHPARVYHQLSNLQQSLPPFLTTSTLSNCIIGNVARCDSINEDNKQQADSHKPESATNIHVHQGTLFQGNAANSFQPLESRRFAILPSEEMTPMMEYKVSLVE